MADLRSTEERDDVISRAVKRLLSVTSRRPTFQYDDDDGSGCGGSGNGSGKGNALWSGSNKNRDVSTGPLSCPIPRSLAPLTHLLAPDCSLRSRPPLRSLVCSLAYFAHSLARGKENF